MDETFQVGVDESLQLFEFRTNVEFAGGNEEEFLAAVANFGEGALEIPAEFESVVLVVLEAAEFFDQIDFELRANPHAKLEGDAWVR
jgi:hypothetical protein